jgi:AcrR family transcriptional regulator
LTDPDRDDRPRYHHGDLRAALLAAAEADLAETGVEGFSLRRVAKRAGVSHAAPAHHFGDADGLLTALAAEGFRLFLATQARFEATAPPDPRAQLRAAGLGYIAFAREHPALFRLMFSSQRPDFGQADLQEWAGRGFGHLVEQVSALLGRPAMASRDDQDTLVAVWAMAHGLADLLAAGRLGMLQALPDQRRDAALAAMIDRAIG